jgi:hypothetical protein
VKVYQEGGQILVAACDEELIGQTFEEGELILKVTAFYDGTIASKEELVVNLKAATCANLVGKRTIEIAVSAGFIDKDGVIRIGGVPHAQLYSI